MTFMDKRDRTYTPYVFCWVCSLDFIGGKPGAIGIFAGFAFIDILYIVAGFNNILWYIFYIVCRLVCFVSIL